MTERREDWIDRLLPRLPEPAAVDRFIFRFCLTVGLVLIGLGLAGKFNC
jgi:hypothetical protein